MRKNEIAFAPSAMRFALSLAGAMLFALSYSASAQPVEVCAIEQPGD